MQAPGQVQQGSGEGRLWCRRQVRFNKVPEKVPEKVPGCFGGSGSVPEKVPEKVSEKVPERLGAEMGQVQRGFKYVPVRFQECVGAVFRSISSQFRMNNSVKTNFCCCWGYHRSLFHLPYYTVAILGGKHFLEKAT